MATNQQYPFEFQTEFANAAQYEEIAKRLLGMAGPPPQGKMVSNHYVRTSPMQHFARMYSQFESGRASDAASRMREEALRRMAAEEKTQLGRVLAQATGQPEIQGNEMDVGQPGIKPDLAKAATMASVSPFTNVQKAGDDIRSRWQTQMTVGASGASDAAKVLAGQTGVPPTEAKPEEKWGPIGNVAPPGMRPIIGQTEQRTGKARFGPGEPIQVNTGDRADRTMVAEHYKMLTDPKMVDTAHRSSETLTTASQALNLIAKVPMNMGTGAGAITEVQKLSKFLGKPVDPRAPASEVYQALVVPMVGQIITQFGAGTGLSDADREFSKQAVALLQRQPEAAQALLMDTIKRAWKYANQYNMMAGAGEEMAKAAGMNPTVFKSIVMPIQFTIAKELKLPDNPWEWPDAYGTMLQGGLGGVNVPQPAPQGDPAPRPWRR